MAEIKGRYRTSIFEGNNGYKVGLFKVKETDLELEDIVNKTITFSGYFADLNQEEMYVLIGEYLNHPKYGYQFQASSYKKIEPTSKDAIIEFLSSSLIRGCGEKTALKIVEKFGENSINKIKETKNNLLLVPGITEKRAQQIYNSIIEYSSSDTILIELQKKGFTIKESLKLINLYGSLIIEIIEDNIYQLIKEIDFNKLDKIFLSNHEINHPNRIKSCIVEALKRLSFIQGDTFCYKLEIYKYIKDNFGIILEEEEFDQILSSLNKQEIFIEEDRYYLIEIYEMENYIAKSLKEINTLTLTKIKNFSKIILNIENETKVKYNKEQLNSIKSSLENRISIITGGPGTGKTTIINGIVKALKAINNWYKEDDLSKIVLLAPTGRASKKMTEVTKCRALTIHRYLKWNKDDDTFGYNEANPHNPKFIIIDETSMVDTFLLNHLLKGINHDCQIVFVGDVNQLPSVGAGLIFNDLINCDKFVVTYLKDIYRQSQNSYIPFLAKEIKEGYIGDEFFQKKDDFNYLEVKSNQIKETIKKICDIYTSKSLKTEDIQVLAPMYKGENGIDNLNVLLQEHFNPQDSLKKEYRYGDIVYRENDKIIQLVNDVDNNVYNGDMGIIKQINSGNDKKILEANFDGSIVSYKKDDLVNIKHAYAISIHKSQGSEFNNVIMPMTMNYSRMLYNKLIYTGITRAKKSLVIVGDYQALHKGVGNNFSENRKTTLKERLTK